MAESVFDRTVNADGSTGVWWRHSFDIAGQNADNDWIDPADPRQVFQDTWPNLPDGITDGNSRSLGLLRCRPTARTWRPSISSLEPYHCHAHQRSRAGHSDCDPSRWRR